MIREAALGALSVAALGACAVPAIAPGQPVDVRAHPIDAMGFH